ncbi:hypothetical protein C5S32_02455 [ANME-1 cluster archaeon GoMg1]|nr:hypothetical protein [ANME-1 cluster archaeon GoMg1]
MVKISPRELERIVSMDESISQEDHIIVDYKVCLEEKELVDEIGAEMALRMTLGSLLPLP